MKRDATIGTGLALDAHKLATGVSACLGARGSGKTNCAAVIAEQVMDAGLQVIVLDQVGPWFSLRLGPGGKQPSRFEIPVLGGTHGDIVLQPQGGRQVAEALARSGSSAVLDVSMMRKGERVRFAADFGEAFFEAMKRSPRPVCVIVEESQRFMPQMMRFSDPALSRCLGAFEEIAEVGRNFGIGLVLISQRPQQINKNVLFLSDTLFAFRTLGVAERKTIGEWVKEKGIAGREEVGDELPSLKAGTAIVWSPAVFDVYGRFKVNLKTTYDASATPDRERAAVQTKPLDLAALEKSMGQVVADAKANDPAALKARVAELERALAAKPGKAAPAPRVVEKPVLTEAQIKRLEKAVERLAEIDARAGEARKAVGIEAESLRAAIRRVVDCNEDPEDADVRRILAAKPPYAYKPEDLRSASLMRPISTPNVDRAMAGLRQKMDAETPRFTAAMRRAHGDDMEAAGRQAGAAIRGFYNAATLAPRAGERAVLTAIAQGGDAGVNKPQLSVLTGYKATARDTYVYRLTAKGFIAKRGSDTWVATPGGVAALGPDFERLPTGPALRQYWLGRLTGGEQLVLRFVCDAYPRSVTKQEIGDATNYKPTARDTYVHRLSARKLVVSDRGVVAASRALFE